MVKIIKFIRKITKFIKRNKIYLDLVLTFFVVMLALNANKIEKQQKEISLKEKNPNFYIKVDLSPIGTNLNEREISLLFYNLSGDYENFNQKTIAEFVIKIPNSRNELIEKCFFINGFFSAEFPGKLKQGLIRSLYGYHNDSKLTKIILSFNTVKDSLGLHYGFTEFHTYTSISYLNFLDEKIIKYYDTSFREGVLLENEAGEKIFSRYEFDSKNGKLAELERIDKAFFVNLIMNEI